MGEDKHRSGISIGSTMLVLIFGIVTLTTFAVLALVSARADLKLANKNKEMVSAYYMADTKGEELLYTVDSQLKELLNGRSSEEYYKAVAELYAENYNSEESILTFEESLNDQLAVNIVLKVLYTGDSGRNYEVLAWNTRNLGDYEMDESMPVWTGEELE